MATLVLMGQEVEIPDEGLRVTDDFVIWYTGEGDSRLMHRAPWSAIYELVQDGTERDPLMSVL